MGVEITPTLEVTVTVTVHPGIAFGGFIAGGGHSRARADLRHNAHTAGELLSRVLGGPVELRFNSDGRSGGAWLTTVSRGGMRSNAEVGVGVSEHRAGFTVFAANIALRTTSPHHTPLDGFVPDPSRAGDITTDLWLGRNYAYTQHMDTLDQVEAFLREHVRPAGDISADMIARHQARDAWVEANTWLVAARSLDEGEHLVVARRDLSVSQWSDPARDALETYTRGCRAFPGTYTPLQETTTTQLGDRVALPEGGLVPGQVYRVEQGRLVPTRYASKKVASL